MALLSMRTGLVSRVAFNTVRHTSVTPALFNKSAVKNYAIRASPPKKGDMPAPKKSILSVVGEMPAPKKGVVPAMKKREEPPAVEIVDDDEDIGEGGGDDAEGDDGDPMDALTAFEQRRILALRVLQAKYDEGRIVFLKESAILQAKYDALNAPLFEERRKVIDGAQKVDAGSIVDDGKPDEGITEFWLAALSNNNKVNVEITDKDAEVLSFLEDIRSEVLVEDERGFKIYFTFKENPHFTNKELVKTYIFESDDLMVPKLFTGCQINWLPGMDTTVEETKERKGGKGGKKSGKEVVLTNPVDSFFTFFKPPVVPENPSTMNDQELMDLQDVLDRDFDIGVNIKDQILPRAVEFFMGEMEDFNDEYDDEREEGEEY